MTRSALTAYSVPTSKYSSRQGYSPRRFILHHTAGGGNQGNINLLAHNDDYEVSCNYLSLNTGEIVSIVPEEYRAWTTGWEADRDSITQETVNTGGAPNWPVSAQQIENVAQLIADCSRRYGWGRIAYGRNFFVHQNFNATACPGPTLMGAITAIVNRANELLGETGWNPAPSGSDGGYQSGTYNGYSVEEIQRLLTAAGFPTEIDNAYGPDTTGQVFDFQLARGLDPDGIVGPLTWAELNRDATPAGKLVVDGALGYRSIMLWQEILGTGADGEIDEPSPLVRRIQEILNAAGARDWDGQALEVDGSGIVSNIGGRVPSSGRWRTIWALQVYLGVPPDGVLDANDSLTIRRVQERLNTGKF